MAVEAESLPHSVRRARIAITVTFFVFGVYVGVWAPHIPIVQERLGLSPSVLGLALLASACGSLASQIPLGMLLARTGSRKPALIFLLVAGAGMPMGIASPSVLFFFVVSFFVGAAISALNVSINTQASEVETLRGLPTMSTFHAAASVGMLSGAVLGSLVIAAGLSNGEGALLVVAIAAAAGAAGYPFFVPDQPKERGAPFVLPNRAVFGLGLLAFLMFIVEGAMVDWSAIFLSQEKGASAAWAAAGFGMFTAAMFCTRMIGNQIILRLGRQLTVVGGAALIVAGVAVAILAPWLAVSALGFGLIGIGAANIVPILISTAAQTPGIPPSVAVGAVGTMLSTGFLFGPPVIGFVADHFGMPTGIAVIGLAALAVGIAAALRTWPPTPGS